MDGIDVTLDLVERGGIVAVFLILAIFIWKKYLVPGWIYEEVLSNLTECQKINATYASRIETRLHQLEEERDKRYGSNPS
jgi:hypothetical protein